MKTVLFTLLLVACCLSTLLGQVMPVDTTNGKLYYILLKDGSHIQGRIIKRDSTMMTVRMKNGQLTYVEKELFSQITDFQPVIADSAAYFTDIKTSGPSQATLSPGQYVITLTDGTTLNGQVLSQDSSRVVLKTKTIGTVYVPAERVVRMERSGVADRYTNLRAIQSIVYPNIVPQYLNLTPTAYQAEKGKAYYRNTMFYFNQFDVGITNNWSIGTGFCLIPSVSFGWLTTKVSVPLGERARIGVQGQYFFGGSDGLLRNSFRTSYVQGIVSLGDSQNNVTFGLGLNAGQGSGGQILTVAFVKKLGPQITLISENQLLLGTGSYVTVGKLGGGVRFDRQRHSFDVSANVPIALGSGRSGFFASVFPVVSYQVRMSK